MQICRVAIFSMILALAFALLRAQEASALGGGGEPDAPLVVAKAR